MLLLTKGTMTPDDGLFRANLPKSNGAHSPSLNIESDRVDGDIQALSCILFGE